MQYCTGTNDNENGSKKLMKALVDSTGTSADYTRIIAVETLTTVYIKHGRTGDQ